MKSDIEHTPVRLLLVGGGHAHVEVVRRLAERPIGSMDVTLLSPAPKAPYSGMLPGFVSGTYNLDDFHIDLTSLCSRSAVTFVSDEATGIDLVSRKVDRSRGPALDFDILSLNVGSTPSLPRCGIAGIPAKPISEFSSRMMALEERIRNLRGSFRLAVVGTGPAGIELAFALRARVEALLGAKEAADVRILLVGQSEVLLPERSPLTRMFLNKASAKRGIEVFNSFNANVAVGQTP